ncbi:hypothetical protein ACFY7C_12330 [Streptomyces sp. NPDC012769]|uniref:hypothetical protein n=1 Tax=Streptomyces sp. NPDC012769 TaxID=3364848 RepID=UPI00369C1679
MAGESDWRNNPHWYLMMLVPLLVILIIEDDTITRSLLVLGLFSGAVVYGRAWVKQSSRRATADRLSR